MGGGVGVVPVLMDLIQTSDQRRGYYKSMAALIKSCQQARGKHPGSTGWTGHQSHTHIRYSSKHTFTHSLQTTCGGRVWKLDQFRKTALRNRSLNIGVVMQTFAWGRAQASTEPCSSLLCEETPIGSDAGWAVSAPVQPACCLDPSP